MEGMIGIKDLHIPCIIGVGAWEKKHATYLTINLKVKYLFDNCVRSDSITHTIDYESLAQICKTVGYSKEFHLIETLAYEILMQVQRAYPEITWAEIKITKTGAVPDADSAFVQITWP